MLAIPIDKPKNCWTCRFKSNKEGECWFVHNENDCPIIDIVTCGECKWKDECILGSYGVSEQGFCYKGERRAE